MPTQSFATMLRLLDDDPHLLRTFWPQLSRLMLLAESARLWVNISYMYSHSSICSMVTSPFLRCLYQCQSHKTLEPEFIVLTGNLFPAFCPHSSVEYGFHEPTSCHGRHSRCIIHWRRALARLSSLFPPPADKGGFSVFLSCFLFGITTVQLYIYWQRFPKDRMLNKVLVWWCWLLDALQTAFSCHVVYYYTV
jgi:hypothetical protein